MTTSKTKTRRVEAEEAGGAASGRMTHTTPNFTEIERPTLPKSLAAALPAAVVIMGHVADIEALIPTLEAQMGRAKSAGAIPLARSFVVLHRLREALLSDERGRFKPIGALFIKYQTEHIPALFEQDGVENVPLAEGFRVGVSHPFRASIKKDQKDAAYAWLRKNGLGDLISSTVNASSLAAALKTKLEDENTDAPEEMFTAGYLPAATVTKT